MNQAQPRNPRVLFQKMADDIREGFYKINKDTLSINSARDKKRERE